MKKFGLGKKSDDDDSGRKALFGSRSKNKSPAPSNNPYANPAAPPDPYTQAKMNAGIVPGAQQGGGPRAPPGAGYGLPSGPAMKKGYGDMGAPNSDSMGNPGYGAAQAGYPDNKGYGDNKYGNQAGYGQERYGNNPYGSSQPAGGRPGGYGGLGAVDDDPSSNDANRDELFGGARERVQQRGSAGYGAPPPPYGTEPAPNGGQERSYGAYGDRQLTAEEEEEEDVSSAKQEIRRLKQQDISSTRNALRVAAEAEETGRNTLARLGAQGERLHNTDRNLDLAGNHQRIAEEKAKELKIANRSMFRAHVDNPFTSRGRERRDQEILDKHQSERQQRDMTRQTAFESDQRMNNNFKSLGQPGPGGAKPKSSLADRAKYQFEADSEDDEMEDEIERNLGEIGDVTGRLHKLAVAQGNEIESQNQLLEGLAKKVSSTMHVSMENILIVHTERPSGRPASHEPEEAGAHSLTSLYRVQGRL